MSRHLAAATLSKAPGSQRLLPVLAVLLLLMLVLPSAVRAESGIKPEAREGVIDLTDWHFIQDGVLSLDGQWDLAWKRLALPKELSRPDSGIRHIEVPSIWGPGNLAAPERQGYGTYRLTLRFSPEETGRLKALYIRNAASAYRIYINGDDFGGNGAVGTSWSTMKPKNYAKVYIFQVRSGDNELVLQVSNFVQRKGGLWSPLLLGEPGDIAIRKGYTESGQLIISSALLTLGLYHLAVAYFRKRDVLRLLIGPACILLAFRGLLLGDTLLVKYIPCLNWEWMVKVEYWSVYLVVPLFAAFVRQLFPFETYRGINRLIFAVSGLFTLLVLVTPARIFTYSMIPFECFLLAVAVYLFLAVAAAVRRRRVGARLCLFAGIVILATVVHDILYYNHLIVGMDLAPFGVLLFFFTQTLVVTLKFSKAYDDVERLSDELSEINMSLEEKIRERTQALEVSNTYLMYANEHLNRVENSRRELIANITHELGTPMTSIQGYMKALLDGVVQPERQYIQILYDKIQMADRLVQDLFDLTKLEEGHTSFHLVDVIADELFDDHFSHFRLDVENQGIRYELEKPEAPEDKLPIVRVDPIRMRQVLANLIGNALKYTGAGGVISVTGAYQEDRLVIMVSDTGTGIEPDLVPRIFDRFFKGAPPRRNSKGGSGLGLAIAKEIVLHHGGLMTVRSEPGHGSTFSFDIPVEFIPMVVD